MVLELKGLFKLAENKPVVRFFEGKAGILQITEDIFTRSAPGTEILDIANLDITRQVLSQEERSVLFDLRLKKRMKMKLIYTSATKDQFINSDERLLEARQVSEEIFHFPGDVTIYGDKVALSSLSAKYGLSGVIIQSSVIAETMRSVFMLAFHGCQKVEKK